MKCGGGCSNFPLRSLDHNEFAGVIPRINMMWPAAGTHERRRSPLGARKGSCETGTLLHRDRIPAAGLRNLSYSSAGCRRFAATMPCCCVSFTVVTSPASLCDVIAATISMSPRRHPAILGALSAHFLGPMDRAAIRQYEIAGVLISSDLCCGSGCAGNAPRPEADGTQPWKHRSVAGQLSAPSRSITATSASSPPGRGAILAAYICAQAARTEAWRN